MQHFFIKYKSNLINKTRIFIDQMEFKLLFKNKSSIHFISENIQGDTCNIVVFDNNYIIFWNLDKYDIINIFNILDIKLTENCKINGEYYEYYNEFIDYKKCNACGFILNKKYENLQKNVLSHFLTIKCRFYECEKK